MSDDRASRGVPLPSVWQIVAITAALVAAWLVWSNFGRIVDEADDGQAGGPLKGLQAVESRLKQGDAAIPELLAALDSTDVKERSQAAFGLGRIGPPADTALDKLRERLTDEDPRVRTYAAYAVAHVDLDKQRAAAAIAPLLADSQQSVREDVAKELLEIGSPALAAIVEMFHNEQAAVRLEVVRVLRSTRNSGIYRGWAGTSGEASKALHDVLNDTDPEVHFEALAVLAEWRQVTLAEVVELLRNEDERRVRIALDAVSFKDEAAELLPDIILLIDKFDGRLSVLPALSSMTTAARSAVPRVLKMLEACDDKSRIPIAQTLFDIGGDPDDIVLLLSPLLLGYNYDRGQERHYAFRVGEFILQVSPAGARRQVSLLIPKLKRADGTVDKTVLYALLSMGTEAHEAVPAIIPLLKNSDPWVAEFAAHVLNKTGLAGVKAAPDLVVVIRNGSRPPLQRQACAEALASLGESAQDFVPDLLEIIAQPDPATPVKPMPGAHQAYNAESQVRAAIIQALGQIGGDEPGLIPALRSQLTSRSPLVRAAAGNALACAAGQSADVLADLIQRLRDDAPTVRAHAALAIGRMTIDRNKAVSPLLMVLADENPFVRPAAAVALGKIGSSAREALPILREFLAQPPASTGNSRAEPLYLPELNSMPFDKAVRSAIEAIEGEPEKETK